MTEPRASRFLWGFSLVLAAVVPLLILGHLFLIHTHEMATLDEIVALQRQSDAIFGSGVHEDHAYKLTLYRAVKPRVVAIGSSRAMGFQQQAFSASFVTMGGALSSIEEGSQLIDDMLAVSKPELIIFAVDYHWFAPSYQRAGKPLKADYQQSTYELLKQSAERRFTRNHLPLRWLYKRKIGVHQFLSGVLHEPVPNSPLPAGIGVRALLTSEGFTGDGHHRYLGTVFGLRDRSDIDYGFHDTIARLHEGKWTFAHSATLSEPRFQQYVELVAKIRRAGIQLITVLPPVAGAVIREIDGSGAEFAYIPEARRRLAGVNRLHYDFNDPATLGASDCEFIDGMHGGEVLYQRIVAAIAADPRSGLAAYVDQAEVARVIRERAGHAISDGPRYEPRFVEKDFLELGCAK